MFIGRRDGDEGRRECCTVAPARLVGEVGFDAGLLALGQDRSWPNADTVNDNTTMWMQLRNYYVRPVVPESVKRHIALTKFPTHDYECGGQYE